MSDQATVNGLYVVGGDFSTFAIDEGNYHVKVADAANTEAKTGRGRLLIDLTVHNDPNHPAKEGKRLMKWGINYASPQDDAAKSKMMKGFLKRLVFDGFGLTWPQAGQDFDPRKLIGREAWVQVINKGDNTEIRAVAAAVENLPIFKPSTAAMAASNAASKKNGATTSARRR